MWKVTVTTSELLRRVYEVMHKKNEHSTGYTRSTQQIFYIALEYLGYVIKKLKSLEWNLVDPHIVHPMGL